MATVALPRPKVSRFPRWSRWLIAVVFIIAVIAVALVVSSAGGSSAAPTYPTVGVTRGTIVSTVAGSGSINTAQVLDLPFQASGTVSQVLVSPGDQVVAGQALAKVDDTLLQLSVANAQAQLNSAQAQLDALTAAPTTSTLTAAKLGLANAQVALQKLTLGPTAAQVAAARQGVLTAQTNLAALSPSSSTTQVQIQTAQAALDTAKNSLWSAQTNRDAICARPLQKIQCDEANATVGNGEIAVSQAQATLNRLLAGPDASALQVAQGAVAQAQANLASLSPAPTALELQAAQLAVQNAQAQMDALNAGPTAADLTKAQAAVTSAKLQLAQAQDNLNNATLRAPFAGVITLVNVVPGSQAGGGGSSTSSAAVEILDRSNLHIDLKLAETDAVNVHVGQPVTISVAALNGKIVTGTVTFVSPSATTTNGVVTYAVTVGFPNAPQDVRVGMTANVTIVTAEKQNVLMVPNTALLPQGSGHVVRAIFSGTGRPGASGTPGARGTGSGRGAGGGFPGASGTPFTNAEGTPFPGANGTPGARARFQNQNASLGYREVPVVTGITDGTYTEIVSGLFEGETIISLPNSTTAAFNRGGGFNLGNLFRIGGRGG